jgi:glycerate 2-kinase
MLSPRALLTHCFQAAVRAVDPEAAVLAALDREPLDLKGVGRIVVVGAGKATAPMAAAIEARLGKRIDTGVIVVKHGHGLPLQYIRVVEAAHPVPDADGAAGAEAVLAAVSGLQEGDLVIALISGGASALLPAPRGDLGLADKQAVNRALLASGAPIEEMNAVRKHLSRIKGGQLARAAQPARVETFILSDVIGDDFSTIASGPTVGDPSTFAEVDAIIRARNITLSPSVRAVIDAGLAGQIPDTPKPGDACFTRVHNRLIASNAQALAAAADEARRHGVTVEVDSQPICGEARDASEHFCRRLVTLAAGYQGPLLLLAGGEPTVTITGAGGLGGRAQEFALAAAHKLAGHDRLSLLAAGTDGSDGPTDAAGGFADGRSVRRAEVKGVDLRDHLQRHDAYPALDALGDLLRSGPTRTNVMDVYLGYAE